MSSCMPQAGVCVEDIKKTIGKDIFTNKGEEMIQRKVYLGAGYRILWEKKTIFSVKINNYFKMQ